MNSLANVLLLTITDAEDDKRVSIPIRTINSIWEGSEDGEDYRTIIVTDNDERISTKSSFNEVMEKYANLINLLK